MNGKKVAGYGRVSTQGEAAEGTSLEERKVSTQPNGRVEGVSKRLLFAPLVRVSTEAQAKRGESLSTQRKQLKAAIDILGGEVYDWYVGQEHATPDQERKILEQLMRDAVDKKFDAVMVADISRWSRDNRKNKEYAEILRKNGIRFFVGTSEMNLNIPDQSLILGMGVEIAEYSAKTQAYKSIINRINKAKDGYLSSSGRVPYGRTFNKKTREWGIDERKWQAIKEAARQYLEGDVPFTVLGERFGMNPAYLREVLTQRCGDTWVQRYREERFKIDEKVEMKIL